MQNQLNSDIFAPGGLETIFEGKLVKEYDGKTGQINNVRIIGYRLESSPNSKIMTHFKTGVDTFGIYKAAIFYEGIRRKANSNKSNFFPAGWTQSNVIEAISDAYKNRKIIDVERNKLSGTTAEGLKIFMWTDEHGKIVDVIPMGDNEQMSRNTRTKPARSICKQCGQKKIKICPSDHLSLVMSILNLLRKNIKKKILSPIMRKLCAYRRNEAVK